MEKLMKDFTQDNPTHRFKRAAMHVRNFSTKQPHDGARLTTEFLCACPKLFSIVFWHMTIPTPLFEISMPGLRRFSFHPHRSLSFTAPLFHSITHLEIAGYDSKYWPFLWSAGLSSLPSLTHLALDAQPHSELQEALLEDLPSSIRVILLRVGDLSETRRFANYSHVVCFTDEMKDATRDLPFLYVFSDDAFYIWTGKPSEEESFWIQGERWLEKREREQVESISYLIDAKEREKEESLP
ncbi:hypothetical protein DL96DRAFT_1613353 [Flagelloscypha sp. PMI_526]|nr:hypothetical protein DL96DRAFT_1613353 [Flagelloscypha sp. PMI_526]